jgi:hypothetical protein
LAFHKDLYHLQIKTSTIKLLKNQDILLDEQLQQDIVFHTRNGCSDFLLILNKVNDDILYYKTKKLKVNGTNVEQTDGMIGSSLVISKYMWSFDGHLLYSRKLDDRLFTLLPPGIGSREWNEPIKGPIQRIFILTSGLSK